MNEKDKIQFNLLKNKIAERFLQEFPGTNSDISKWKGLDIVYFQEHLLKKVRGNVSEKWFYTYFKQEIYKLPRIDMLNLLSEYVGYKSWNHFVSDQKTDNETITPEIEQIAEVKVEQIPTIETPNVSKKEEIKKKPKYAIWISGIVATILAVFGINYAVQPDEYTFCFIDAVTNKPIREELEITILNKQESAKQKTLHNNCFTYLGTDKDTLEMKVVSKFHKETTFKYILSRYIEPDTIKIKPDEYALMLNYYVTSTQKIKDKQKKLRNLITNNAIIYQVFDNEVYGVEVLTKEQYIGLVTLPTESLKKYIQILSETNDNGKITKIKFKIQENEK